MVVVGVSVVKHAVAAHMKLFLLLLLLLLLLLNA